MQDYDEPMSTTVPRLPGEELLQAGLDDLSAGRESESALIVQVAAPRLRWLGYEVPEPPAVSPDGEYEPPGQRLYSLLVRERGTGAHSRYNALLARMASFARAAGHASTG